MKIFLPLPDWITFEEWSKLIEIKEIRAHLKLSNQTPTEVAHTFYGVKHPILHIRPWYISHQFIIYNHKNEGVVLVNDNGKIMVTDHSY